MMEDDGDTITMLACMIKNSIWEGMRAYRELLTLYQKNTDGPEQYAKYQDRINELDAASVHMKRTW